MTYTIEKNIPIPSIGRGALLTTLEAMEVGDSTFVSDKKQQNIATTMKKAAKDGKAYTMRKEAQEGKVFVFGYRVWRTA